MYVLYMFYIRIGYEPCVSPHVDLLVCFRWKIVSPVFRSRSQSPSVVLSRSLEQASNSDKKIYAQNEMGSIPITGYTCAPMARACSHVLCKGV